MAVDYNNILKFLNSAGIQRTQPALYQAINSLVSAGYNSQNETIARIAELQTSVKNSLMYGTTSERNNYKPSNLVGNIVVWFDTDTDSFYVFNYPTETWVAIGGAPADADYITWSDESAVLPNSRWLREGVGIDFNDATANQRFIHLEIHPFLLMGA
jgi:hypothetical protein